MQIEGFLPVGGVMGITSYPGVGKTWLALETVRAISSGTPFLGRFRATRGGVLFIGSDSSLYDYAQQWTRLTASTPDAESMYEPARFLIASPFMFEDRDEIRKLIRSHQLFEWGEPYDGPQGPERHAGFHTIIFDTLSKLTRAQQNDNTEMEEVFRHIRWIAEATDCACILLHHNSKKSEFNDGSDWRGAMSQIGGLDSWVHLSPARNNKYLIGVQYKKFRGITPEDFAYKMNVMDPLVASLSASDEKITAEQKIRHNVLSQHIHDYLKAHPGSLIKQLQAALWQPFSDGVTDGDTVLKFDTPAKFNKAIHNRIAKMLELGEVTRELNEEGKPIYTSRNITKLVNTAEDLDAVTDALDTTSTRPPKVRKKDLKKKGDSRKRNRDDVRKARKLKQQTHEES